MTFQPESPLYVCEIMFLRAENVAVADISDLSCDPSIIAKLNAPNGTLDSKLTYKTHTMRSTLNPTYNSRWIVTGIPETGFTLNIDLMDEDVENGDDHLGNVTIDFSEGASKHPLQHISLHVQPVAR